MCDPPWCDSHKFLFNWAVRGIERCTSPNDLIKHTERHTVLAPPPPICQSHQVNGSSTPSFTIKSLTFLSVKVPRLGAYCVSSRFVIILSASLFITLFVSPSLKCDSQWKPLIQDVQAQEEYPGGFSPVRAVETCRGYAGKWKPAYGCHVARGWRPKWVGRSQQ